MRRATSNISRCGDRSINDKKGRHEIGARHETTVFHGLSLENPLN
jgi:hypothetical protein